VSDPVAAATFGSWFVFDPPDLDLALQAAAVRPDRVVVVTGPSNRFPAGTAFDAGFTFAADQPPAGSAFGSGFAFSDLSLVG
jgi:hypothetical protein